MYLRSLWIENYRAIQEASITFEETTVLIGENDCGRSSVIEALLLILGAPEVNFETRLQPIHFHRAPDGAVGPLRIGLRVEEEALGQWVLPKWMEKAFHADPGHRRKLDFDFRAAMAPGGAVTRGLTISSPSASGPIADNNGEGLRWLRELVPVLWLRSGLLSGYSEPGGTGAGELASGKDPVLRALEQHHRNLLTGITPDLAAELDAGAKAAQEALKKYKGIFASAGPLMSAMASDILSRRPLSTISPERQSDTSSHKIGVLLLLGAIIQLVDRRLSPQGKPVLLIETPESNLHPMTLAVVWKIIERLVWQKIVTTNSGTILTASPLSAIRRLTRHGGKVTEWSVPPRALSKDALRRVSYHLRSRRASAMLARCWLLVEGETEYWILPELARICGFDLNAEGVACVEFAQCGLIPLTKLANNLGIAWNVLVDGDDAGQQYARAAAAASQDSLSSGRVTAIQEKDIEHCFWQNGFADVIQQLAFPASPTARRGSASATIRKAIDRTSKPFLALRLIDAVADRGAQSIPPVIRQAIESSIALARTAPLR